MSDLDHDIKEGQLSEIQCPTLIIHSKKNDSVSFEYSGNAHKMIENSILFGLDNE
jgi:dipeptidyl aminopeptidase/acylaminoacyl peptidase